MPSHPGQDNSALKRVIRNTMHQNSKSIVLNREILDLLIGIDNNPLDIAEQSSLQMQVLQAQLFEALHPNITLPLHTERELIKTTARNELSKADLPLYKRVIAAHRLISAYYASFIWQTLDPIEPLSILKCINYDEYSTAWLNNLSHTERSHLGNDVFKTLTFTHQYNK